MNVLRKMSYELTRFTYFFEGRLVALHNVLQMKLLPVPVGAERSEERRVGKECRLKISLYFEGMSQSDLRLAAVIELAYTLMGSNSINCFLSCISL